MDYTPGATHLAKWQWEIIRYPALFTDPFGNDEEGMKFIEKYADSEKELSNKYAYLLPTGKAIKIENIKSGSFNIHGHLISFKINKDNKEELYLATYKTIGNTDIFYGYINSDYNGNAELTEDFVNKNRFKAYIGANIGDSVLAYAKNYYINNNNVCIYINCICRYCWLNSSTINEDTGNSKERIIPDNAIKADCSGNNCNCINNEVKDGFGSALYNVLCSELQRENNDVTQQQKDDLAALANMLTDLINEEGKKEVTTDVDPRGYYFAYAFYADDAEFESTDDAYIKYFKDNKIYTVDKFNDIFRYKLTSRDYALIYSTVDLWDGIDDEFRELYNGVSIDWTSFSVPQINTEEELFDALDRLEYVVTQIKEEEPSTIETGYENLMEYIAYCTDNPEEALSQKFHLNQTIRNIYAHLGAYEQYEYSYADLRVRYRIKQSDNVLWTVINNLEKQGYASAISQSDEYRQYINYYGTESAYFLGQQYEGMIGIVYSLYGIHQTVTNIGAAIRNINQQRYNLKIATNRYNLFTSEIKLGNAEQGFKSFSAFKRAMGRAGDNMEWHHIVEQHESNITKFGAEKIHNTSNLIKLSKDIHIRISGYYSSIQPFTSGLTVRQWVGTQDYQGQYSFGIETLNRFGWTP
jgi:hypothetical protein